MLFHIAFQKFALDFRYDWPLGRIAVRMRAFEEFQQVECKSVDAGTRSARRQAETSDSGVSSGTSASKMRRKFR